MTERASPAEAAQGLGLDRAHGGERASPAEAAQSLGLHRAHGGERARPAEGTIPVARNIFLQNRIKVLDRHCGVW